MWYGKQGLVDMIDGRSLSLAVDNEGWSWIAVV
jgi:hypothetical protein